LHTWLSSLLPVSSQQWKPGNMTPLGERKDYLAIFQYKKSFSFIIVPNVRTADDKCQTFQVYFTAVSSPAMGYRYNG
jgi:hypothetical protein